MSNISYVPRCQSLSLLMVTVNITHNRIINLVGIFLNRWVSASRSQLKKETKNLQQTSIYYFHVQRQDWDIQTTTE